MKVKFSSGHYAFIFDTDDSDPICAKLVSTPMVGRTMNLNEVQDLADAVNGLLDAMTSEQFSRDYDAEQKEPKSVEIDVDDIPF
jgi:hypothetical protein